MHAMHMRVVEHPIRRGLCTPHAAWVNHTENRCRIMSRRCGPLYSGSGFSLFRFFFALLCALLAEVAAKLRKLEGVMQAIA
jgi:hypothetical protein